MLVQGGTLIQGVLETFATLTARGPLNARTNITAEGNIQLPDAKLGDVGNLYFGGITDQGQTGMRLFRGVVNGPPTGFPEIRAGFIDVKADANDEGLRIRVDIANGGTERMRVTSNNVQHFVRLSDQSCDMRTKTNIQQLDGALDKLEHVRGVAFVWDESSSDRGVPGQPSIGVIAQEVEEVFPELVFDSGDEEGYKGVDYSGLTAALIEAAKELKAENEALRSRVEALEQA
jgi:Chaperone of endosialidase